MKHNFVFLLVAGSLLACNQNQKMETKSYQWPTGIQAPVADKKPFDVGYHGDKRMDEYYWLNDYFKKGPDSTKVVDYLVAENKYLDTMMAGLKPFQDKLFEEMKARIKEKDESLPVFQNGYYYYNKFEEGKQYASYCRKKGSLDAPEELLLDLNKMAEGHGYFSAVGLNVSPDNKLMSYGIDTISRRQYTLYIKNLETGEIYKDIIYPTSGNSEWGNDNKTLFYIETNPVTLLSERVKRHVLGTEVAADVLVYEEKDHSNYVWVDKTKSDKYIVINSAATLSSEVRILDADKPSGDFKLFQPRLKDVLYSIDHAGDKFLVVTNKEAINFKLVAAPLDKTGVENWKDIIPHRADVLLEGVEVFKDFIVITERKEGLLNIRVRNLADNQEHYLDFGEPAYLASVGSNPEFNSGTLRFNYTSMVTPASTYDYDMASRTKKLMKQTEVMGGYDQKEYVTERLFATARDGARVPISIVYKKGLVKDGTAPLLLNAYGSYGITSEATFNSTRLSLLNRGFVFAIAHIRGGQEMGRQWYEDGKMMKKKNSFNDFIDCGEFLVKEKFTSPQHLYAIGGSAGGLLMGAIVTQKPELWNGVIAAVPFVDVVTTMMDESIPLTTNEFDEWGNPKANKETYDYLKSYSPYDNVTAKNYPNLLVTTGLHDSQVQYFEPAKWVARLRATKTGNQVLLLHTNMEAGHGGASGRFNYLKEIALEYVFLLGLEGITN